MEDYKMAGEITQHIFCHTQLNSTQSWVGLISYETTPAHHKPQTVRHFSSAILALVFWYEFFLNGGNLVVICDHPDLTE